MRRRGKSFIASDSDELTLNCGGVRVLQEEDPPPSLRPLLIIQLEGGAAFDEEGNDDLYALNEFFDRRICQFPSPYLKFSTSACVAFNELPRRFEVLCGAVILNVVIKFGRFLESTYTYNMRFLNTRLCARM